MSERIFEVGSENSTVSTPRPLTPSSCLTVPSRPNSRPSSRPGTPTGRRPFHYYGSIGRPPSNLDNSALQPSRVVDAAVPDQNVYMRYKYYSRLRQGVNDDDDALLIPDHVIPSPFFLPLISFPSDAFTRGQSSLVTIFAIWNTMMGTSLLSMPWAMQRAGMVLGPLLMLFMFVLTLYTSYRVLKAQSNAGITGDTLELPILMRLILGRWAEYSSLAFSMLALIGACIAYWILLTNFLYSMVDFMHNDIYHEHDFSNESWANHSIHPGNVICPKLMNKTVMLSVEEGDPTDQEPPAKTAFDTYWTLNLTAPLALFLLLFPLMNVRSPSFFMKFNALGTISVAFIAVFIGVKVGEWGFHVDIVHPESPEYIELFTWESAHVLTGILALAMFTHNVVITIMSTQKNPENNGRDLSLAYVCVTLTYMSIGLLFWLSFPLNKDCIEDNFLNNFSGNDVLAAVARCFLLFQLTTVFPLLCYVIRTQFMFMVFESVYPGFWPVFGLNVCLAFICMMFTIFLPQIGTIIRFAGALCGMALVFTLPCIAYMTILKRQKLLTTPKTVFHIFVIILGVVNFVLQFFGGE